MFSCLTTGTHIYVYARVYVYRCQHKFTGMYLQIHIHAHMHCYIYVWNHLSIYMSMYICTFTHIWACAIRVCIHAVVFFMCMCLSALYECMLYMYVMINVYQYV